MEPTQLVTATAYEEMIKQRHFEEMRSRQNLLMYVMMNNYDETDSTEDRALKGKVRAVCRMFVKSHQHCEVTLDYAARFIGIKDDSVAGSMPLPEFLKHLEGTKDKPWAALAHHALSWARSREQAISVGNYGEYEDLWNQVKDDLVEISKKPLIVPEFRSLSEDERLSLLLGKESKRAPIMRQPSFLVGMDENGSGRQRMSSIQSGQDKFQNTVNQTCQSLSENLMIHSNPPININRDTELPPKKSAHLMFKEKMASMKKDLEDQKALEEEERRRRKQEKKERKEKKMQEEQEEQEEKDRSRKKSVEVEIHEVLDESEEESDQVVLKMKKQRQKAKKEEEMMKEKRRSRILEEIQELNKKKEKRPLNVVEPKKFITKREVVIPEKKMLHTIEIARRSPEPYVDPQRHVRNEDRKEWGAGVYDPRNGYEWIPDAYDQSSGKRSPGGTPWRPGGIAQVKLKACEQPELQYRPPRIRPDDIRDTPGWNAGLFTGYLNKDEKLEKDAYIDKRPMRGERDGKPGWNSYSAANPFSASWDKWNPSDANQDSIASTSGNQGSGVEHTHAFRPAGGGSSHTALLKYEGGGGHSGQYTPKVQLDAITRRWDSTSFDPDLHDDPWKDPGVAEDAWDVLPRQVSGEAQEGPVSESDSKTAVVNQENGVDSWKDPGFNDRAWNPLIGDLGPEANADSNGPQPFWDSSSSVEQAGYERSLRNSSPLRSECLRPLKDEKWGMKTVPEESSGFTRLRQSASTHLPSTSRTLGHSRSKSPPVRLPRNTSSHGNSTHSRREPPIVTECKSFKVAHAGLRVAHLIDEMIPDIIKMVNEGSAGRSGSLPNNFAPAFTGPMMGINQFSSQKVVALVHQGLFGDTRDPRKQLLENGLANDPAGFLTALKSLRDLKQPIGFDKDPELAKELVEGTEEMLQEVLQTVHYELRRQMARYTKQTMERLESQPRGPSVHLKLSQSVSNLDGISQQKSEDRGPAAVSFISMGLGSTQTQRLNLQNKDVVKGKTKLLERIPRGVSDPGTLADHQKTGGNRQAGNAPSSSLIKQNLALSQSPGSQSWKPRRVVSPSKYRKLTALRTSC